MSRAKISINIPGTLRAYCRVEGELQVSATNVRGALEELRRAQPALYRSVCDETDAVRPHINLFVNSTLLARSDHARLEASLVSDDVLTIWTAVSGG